MNTLNRKGLAVNYATWNLSLIDDKYFDGPEATIVERGGSAIAIFADGEVTESATILGKVQGDITGLDRWNVVGVSRTEAEAFIEATFVPSVDENGVERTLADALKVLD